MIALSHSLLSTNRPAAARGGCGRPERSSRGPHRRHVEHDVRTLGEARDVILDDAQLFGPVGDDTRGFFLLEPGGLLLIEPWFAPGQYWTGRLTTNHVAEEDIKITWMYVSEQRDLISVLDIHYLVATRAGVECFNELHELGLFTPDEYRAAIVDAGLKHEYDEHGFFGRGLHVGIANR